MIEKISNEYLEVQVSSLGAEVQSIRDVQGCEFLWQGTDDALRLRAPILFPFVSWMYESSFVSEGTVYHIPFLGFALKKEMRMIDRGTDYLIYEMKSDLETRQSYPFEFTFHVKYYLEKSSLKAVFSVVNEDVRTMHFSFGWHPTFRVPLEEELAFNDYCYQFDSAAKPLRVMRDAGKYLGSFEEYPLENDTVLRFDDANLDDVIVLRDVSKGVTIQSAKGNKKVHVSYPDMRLLVIFHKKNVPFITVEGWTSYMGRNGIVEDLANQPDLIPLPAGCEYRNEWTITCS